MISEPAGKQRAQRGKKASLLGSLQKEEAMRLYNKNNYHHSKLGSGRAGWEPASRLPTCTFHLGWSDVIARLGHDGEVCVGGWFQSLVCP